MGAAFGSLIRSLLACTSGSKIGGRGSPFRSGDRPVVEENDFSASKISSLRNLAWTLVDRESLWYLRSRGRPGVCHCLGKQAVITGGLQYATRFSVVFWFLGFAAISVSERGMPPGRHTPKRYRHRCSHPTDLITTDFQDAYDEQVPVDRILSTPTLGSPENYLPKILPR